MENLCNLNVRETEEGKPNNKNRSASFRRKQRYTHIARRKRICHFYKTYTRIPHPADGGTAYDTRSVQAYEYYKHDGQYDKGKIHDKCRMDRPYFNPYEPTVTDRRNMMAWEDKARDAVEDSVFEGYDGMTPGPDHEMLQNDTIVWECGPEDSVCTVEDENDWAYDLEEVKPNSGGRTAKYRRNQRFAHIARRKRICHFYLSVLPLGNPGPMEWYRHDGQYNKGKIHCSCPMCRPYHIDHAPNISTARRLEAWQDEADDAMRYDDRDILFGDFAAEEDSPDDILNLCGDDTLYGGEVLHGCDALYGGYAISVGA